MGMVTNPIRSLPGIHEAVAGAFHLALHELTSGRRTTYRTTARGVAAYLMRRTGLYSWSDIARALAYKDHSSAWTAADAVPRRMQRHPHVADLVHALEVRLGLPISGQEHLGAPTAADPQEAPQ